MSENLSSKTSNENQKVGFKDEGLPKHYNDTKLVILPRDPNFLYAYWEVSASTIGELSTKLRKQNFAQSSWVLRVYDVTDINFNGSNANKYFDIYIGSESDNWYINVLEVNRVWCVDLGLITPDGNFVFITRSNVISTPRKGVSIITDEHWGSLSREFEKIFELSGIQNIGKTSIEVSKLLRERWEEMLGFNIPSSYAPSSLSSRKQKLLGGKGKSFWLKADTEITVYGVTEPDASLSFNREKLALKPDGSFSLRFFLPDGSQEYAIEALSNDGTMKKRIVFSVTKKTE